MANITHPTITIIKSMEDTISIETDVTAVSETKTKLLKLDSKTKLKGPTPEARGHLAADGSRKSKLQTLGQKLDTVSVGAVSAASVRQYNDNLDWSCHPSYTKFKLPYEVVCRQRYSRIAKKYDAQFRSELEKLETMQPSAYEALRFNRIFSITTLWPPLHTKKEIDYVLQNFFKTPPNQQARLNYLLKEEQT